VGYNRSRCQKAGTFFSTIKIESRRCSEFASFGISLRVPGISTTNSPIPEVSDKVQHSQPQERKLKIMSFRHWAVFFSGFALVIIFWVLTPLQSAVFTTQQVTRLQPTVFTQPMTIANTTEQCKLLNGDLFLTAYGVQWLKMKLPSFTTKSETFLPFNVQQPKSETSATETWLAETDVYSSELVCKPGVSSGLGIPRAWLNNTAAHVWENATGAVNASGCYYNIDFNIVTNVFFAIAEPWMNDTTPYGSSEMKEGYFGGDCSGVDLVIAWANKTESLPTGKLYSMYRPGSRYKATSLFCKAEYRKSSARVTIGSSKEVLGPANRTRDWQHLSNETFNKTLFLQTLHFGRNTDPDAIKTDQPESMFFNPPARLKTGVRELSVAAAFPESAAGLNITDLADPEILYRLYNDAHSFLFSIAMSLYMRTPEGFKRPAVVGERHITGEAVIVVPTLARILEGFLAVVAMMCLLLLITNVRRQSHLHSDPDSIAAKMALVSESTRLLRDFDGLDECHNIEKHLAPDIEYRLGNWRDREPYYRLDRDGGICILPNIA